MERKPVVMLVEDNATTQATLKRDLEALGIEVLQAVTAEKAWAFLEEGKNPDALILDFELPGEDGPDFFIRVRDDSRFDKIPIIPFTALLNQDNAQSLSKVRRFAFSREVEADHIYPIVSKMGREDIYQTPSKLIQAIKRALVFRGVEVPEPMREALRKLDVEFRVKKMDTSGNGPEGQ